MGTPLMGKVGGVFVARAVALLYDANTEKVTVPNQAQLNFGADDEINLVIFSEYDAGGLLVSKWDADIGFKVEWGSGADAGKIIFTIGDGVATPSIKTDNTYDDDVIHQIMAIRNQTTEKIHLYVDNVEDPAGGVADTTGTLSNAANLIFGDGGTGDGFLGRLGEIHLRSKAPSATERTRIWKRFGQRDKYTRGIWRVNERVGTTLYDESVNANNGTISGATWTHHANVVTGEAVGTGDGTETVFYLDNPYVREVTVKLNGVAQDEALYSLTPKGKITFKTAPGEGVAITADYKWYKMSQHAGFTAWRLTASAELRPCTDFCDANDDGWERVAVGLARWEGAAEGHWAMQELPRAIGEERLVMFVLDVNTPYYFLGWGKVKGVSVTAPLGEIVDSPVTFEGHGQLSKETT